VGVAKILIVDDEPFNVSYLAQEIQDLGYQPITAYDGLQALKSVTDYPPDLILLDIMMPALDGFDVLRRLKQSRETREIPVIIISALTDLPNVIRGIEMGAEDYLPKPYDPVLLRARISNALQKRAWLLQEKQYLDQIETEKQRADALLHVILPDEIVHELKENNSVQPRYYSAVAVMFVDVVGFTPYSETRTPHEVVTNLQTMIEAYEELALKHGLQKIKTIGDAFMTVGGLLKPLENPVLNSVRCGLEMISVAPQLPDPWNVRVGIHYGPVLSGVVGKHQYMFDIWGDTVNTAQRVESHGKPGAVNLTQRALQQVTNYYFPISLGKLDVKGKGLMEIWAIEPDSIPLGEK
jgi:DNA-binding response OmpR family regulator